jgi:hypothetical protein
MDLVRQLIDPLVEVPPVGGQAFNDACHLGRQGIGCQDAGQLCTKEAVPLPDGNTSLEEKCSDLIDDAGALADQPFAHPVQRLRVELLDRLGRDKLHGWTLDRLGDGLGVPEVVLLPLGVSDR